MRSTPVRFVPASFLVLTLAVLPSLQQVSASAASVLPEISTNRSAWLGPNRLGIFVRKLVDGRTVCLEATSEQAAALRDRDPSLPLSELVPESDPSRSQKTGLKIILRGTPQLRGFPTATEAFKRAAARWEALILSQLTVVIDVDFGRTSFGKPFEPNVVGNTDAQVLGGNSLYPAVRAALISEAYNSDKVSLYNSLPLKAVPTDGGQSPGLAATTATLRALGVINQVADPAAESTSFGPPPAIALNSSVNFDFDSGDGIAPDKLDFEAIALHEIGHILGFISFVGQREADSSLQVEPSIWDLFRVRPDAPVSDFAVSPRIVSSGGDQSFFEGDAMMSLSTGRPDGTGGDGRQPSHWKDDGLTGKYIGAMDPTMGYGEHYFITDNDIAVLYAIGYRAIGVNQASQLVPLISGQPQNGGMVAPPAGLGVVSHTQFFIAVPSGATQLRIDLNGTQDIDLFARFGERVFIQGFRVESDYFSAGDSGSETITITPASERPLRQGIYYIAVANYGPGETLFTVTATVSGGATSRPPAIFNLNAHLDGDSLELSYTGVDLDGDFATADPGILDESGRPLKQASSFAINSGNSTRIESQLSIAGMRAIPTAARASLVLVDQNGNRSSEAIIDLTTPETGGLTVIGASFDGSRLTLNTRGLTDGLQVEVNGQIVAPPRGIKVKGSGNKMIIKGDAGTLALHQGPNRIRVKNINGWSNIFLLNI
jgi:hypothetical protein